MKIVFFNRPKARQFDYKPRYYDEDKEKRDQRKKELGLGDKSDKRAMFKGELQNRWRSDRKVEKESTRRRTVIYIILIGFVVYYIFFTDFIQKFVKLITAI